MESVQWQGGGDGWIYYIDNRRRCGCGNASERREETEAEAEAMEATMLFCILCNRNLKKYQEFSSVFIYIYLFINYAT